MTVGYRGFLQVGAHPSLDLPIYLIPTPALIPVIYNDRPKFEGGRRRVSRCRDRREKHFRRG